MNLADLDVAYVVRPGDRNEELRYSLRSVAANLPHLDITLAGHIPPWIDPHRTVGIHVAQTDHAKPLNALGNLHAILDCTFLTDDVILMNDDFFVVEPVTEITVHSPGPLSWQIDRGMARSERYRRAQLDTVELLTRLGRPNPWSYEGHRPLIVNRHELTRTLARIRHQTPDLDPIRRASILWRTVHGSLLGLDHSRGSDVKIDQLTDQAYPRPFLSTNDSTFQRGEVGRWLRARYPEPSKYERGWPDPNDPWSS